MIDDTKWSYAHCQVGWGEDQRSGGIRGPCRRTVCVPRGGSGRHWPRFTTAASAVLVAAAGSSPTAARRQRQACASTAAGPLCSQPTPTASSCAKSLSTTSPSTPTARPPASRVHLSPPTRPAHRRRPQPTPSPAHLQQLRQLELALRQALAVRRVDDIDQRVRLVKIVAPAHASTRQRPADHIR